MRKPTQIFVQAEENGLGVGKLLELGKDAGKVAYTRSPAERTPLLVTVPRGSLKRVTLSPHTRVYWHNSETSCAEVGRVLDYQREDQRYLVRFPNEVSRMIPEEDLTVRCRDPIQDPTDHLALQLNETAFWHEGRSELVRHIHAQRTATGGLTALVSSSIELVQHQTAVIRRVLNDPFQRYLLADEVGLGKTIEAGVLIRQFVLDQPLAHETLIIVPKSLAIQWQQELLTKFHLAKQLGATIHIVASDDHRGIMTHGAKARLVVIDEAHHLSAWAWSEEADKLAIYTAVSQIVASLQCRLLLLSATPVLHHEKAFLAMLCLLDPQVYSLEQLTSFKKRLELRQEVAESMVALVPSESNYFIAETVGELSKYFPDDEEYKHLSEQLRILLENDVPEDDSERVSLIHALRTHVSDTWRVHRRILRNRRNGDNSWCSPGRKGYEPLKYSSHDERGLAEAVDLWRVYIANECYGTAEEFRLAACQLVREVQELSDSEPALLIKFIERRLMAPRGSTPFFNILGEDEVELLQQIQRAASRCKCKEKLCCLQAYVQDADPNESLLIFASHTLTADRIYEFLRLDLPGRRVFRHTQRDLSWGQFKSDRNGAVLVCDQTAEEGLNLQKRNATVVHFDLPLSPNRIEQRMGRLDRFGSGRPIQSVVMQCDGVRSQEIWCRLAGDAFEVFSRSIATLQYVLETEMSKVWQQFLDGGYEAFEDAFQRLAGTEGVIATEHNRIRAQDELDAFDEEVLSRSSFERLEASDRELSREAGTVIDRWLVSKLSFIKRGENDARDQVFWYGFTRRDDFGRGPGRHAKDTLLSLDDFRTTFADSIDEVDTSPPIVRQTVPLTCDRVVAHQRSTRLLRVGDAFVESLERLARWDDRGMCFAFWRWRDDYQCEGLADQFFRFDFVVGPNLHQIESFAQAYSNASLASLIRRSETIMPPRFATIWLDANLERVTDANLLAFLSVPYQKGRDARRESDFNLNVRRWRQASKVIDLSLWSERCVRASQVARQILQERSKLPDLVKSCAATVNNDAKRIAQQFSSRIRLATGELCRSLENECEFEAAFSQSLLKAIERPSLRIDSAGCIFVSAQKPFVESDHVEDDE